MARAGGVCRWAALAALLIGFAPCAHAQLAASAVIESDYRFRGISLTHGQPDVQLNLSYDHQSGAYAGLSLIGSRDGKGGIAGVIDYAGYATPRIGGVAWEAGIANMHFHDQGRYDYDEVYAGLITEDFTARLSWSPHYYGRDARTLYADLNGGRRLSDRWRVFAHAGMLTPLSGAVRRERYDFRAGVAAMLGPSEVQLALTHTNPLPAYAGARADRGTALVLSAAWFF